MAMTHDIGDDLTVYFLNEDGEQQYKYAGKVVSTDIINEVCNVEVVGKGWVVSVADADIESDTVEIQM